MNGENLPPVPFTKDTISDPQMLRLRSAEIVRNVVEFGIKAGPSIAFGLSGMGTSPEHTAVIGGLLSIPISLTHDLWQIRSRTQFMQSNNLSEDYISGERDRAQTQAVINAVLWGVRGAGIAWGLNTPVAQKLLTDTSQFITENFLSMPNSVPEAIGQTINTVKCASAGLLAAGVGFFHHEVNQFMQTKFGGDHSSVIVAHRGQKQEVADDESAMTRADWLRRRKGRI